MTFAAATAMSARRQMSWTAATIRWWDKLGHIDGCSCPRDLPIGGGQRTFDIDTFNAIFRCWRQAANRLFLDRPFSPREHAHATRAMYAFRDRLSWPVTTVFKECPRCGVRNMTISEPDDSGTQTVVCWEGCPDSEVVALLAATDSPKGRRE